MPDGQSDPFIPYGRQLIEEDDVASVVAVLRGPYLTQGPAVAAFEEAVAGYTGARHAVAVSSGTAALHLACIAAGLDTSKSAVTSPITFLATANAPVYVGAKTVFCDVDANVNLSPAKLKETLSRVTNVGAVLPVHFGGAPCDMVEIRRLANAAGAVVIEDAAHALGGSYIDGGRIGNCAHADMTIFSFHPVKLVAAGEGGVITTNSEALAARLRMLRNHGIHKADEGYRNPELASTGGTPNPWYYEMHELGFHYRLTDIQAALGKSQLSKIGRFIERRRDLVARYDAAFSSLEFAHPIQTGLRSRSGHHLYVLRIDFTKLNRSRAEMMESLRLAGIGTQVHYIPVHLQPFHARAGFKRGDFPEAERFYDQALSLPLFHGMSDREQDRVIAGVKALLP